MGQNSAATFNLRLLGKSLALQRANTGRQVSWETGLLANSSVSGLYCKTRVRVTARSGVETRVLVKSIDLEDLIG